MLNWIDQRVPVRFVAFFAVVALWVLSALQLVVGQASFLWVLLLTGLVALGVYDLQQTGHAILRNYPIIGHLRFLLEFVRPELRQYFIEGDHDAVPFSRSQRSLVYARAKGQTDKVPFGTQVDVHALGYEWLTHSISPSVIASHNFRVQVGGAQCTQPYSISLFNVSAMSFGALSANAVMALNLGAKKGGFAHDTGEGSISRYHREHGGDLIWEIGSGYFGCRNDDGTFNAEKFKKNALSPQVKMIEIKLSQGAKPGHGGVLPGPKVTPEIAEARGVPVGVDCISPAAHSSFSTPTQLLQFVQSLREMSGGKPVGFKLCIGHPWEWFGIAKAMTTTGILPDFIVVDGSEGGTGAAPLELTDHMGMPMLEGLRLVHNTLVGLNLRQHIRLGASGKIISGFDVLRTVALGADWCNSARGFMFALGCIQAQTCHTGNCPTGVTTQDPKRQIALVVPNKSERVLNFHRHTLESVQELLQATGLSQPSDLSLKHIMRRMSDRDVKNLDSLMPSVAPGSLLNSYNLTGLFEQYWADASADQFQLKASAE
ncbi:FMN-binding glutamate synthase family protein [Limnohabitans sp. Rim11]|uniref:FMN-binding glutamate synthase family protein n=1 Tax=Limnohabitans sp. Rim11 TaxID=1100719 RepID=UPI000AAEFF2B|nr:FMN-binding glutamate synthase family protein [Limnohabitans sp. Rim11]